MIEQDSETCNCRLLCNKSRDYQFEFSCASSTFALLDEKLLNTKVWRVLPWVESGKDSLLVPLHYVALMQNWVSGIPSFTHKEYSRWHRVGIAEGTSLRVMCPRTKDWIETKGKLRLPANFVASQSPLNWWGLQRGSSHLSLFVGTVWNWWNNQSD